MVFIRILGFGYLSFIVLVFFRYFFVILIYFDIYIFRIRRFCGVFCRGFFIFMLKRKFLCSRDMKVGLGVSEKEKSFCY